MLRRRCEQCIAITRRIGGNDDSDRDCVCGVGAYGLGHLDGDHVPVDEIWGEVSAAGQLHKRTAEFV